MGSKLKSVSDDSVILGIDERGILIGLVPSEPSSDGKLDVFQGQVRFTNVTRAMKALAAGGVFRTSDGAFKITGDKRTCTLAFKFNHKRGEWFECKLGVAATDQLLAFMRDALEGSRVVGPGDALTSPDPKVGRNDKCPCGSGKKYKKCCIGDNDGPKVSLPEELIGLKEKGDAHAVALVSEYSADPKVISDKGYWCEVAQAAEQCNLYETAEWAVRRALAIDPDEPVLKSNLAVYMGLSGNCTAALEVLSTVPSGTKRKALVTANILQDLERHEEAIPLYEEAIREEPEFFLPYARILNSLKATRSVQYDLWLERALEAHPSSPALAHYFVRRCLEEGRYDELADAEWIEGLRSSAGRTGVVGSNADDPKLIIECQLMHFALKILRDQDSNLLETVLDTLRSVPDSWSFCEPAKIIAVVSAKMGSLDGVRSAFSRVCDKCVADRVGIDCERDGYLAVANAYSGKHEEAKRLYEDCLARDPDNIMLLWHHWWVLDELEETEEAINQAEKLYELKPDLDLLCYNLGYLCGKCGQIGKSIYYYRQELSRTPDNCAAIENLCFSQLLQNDLTAARDSFRVFRELVREQVEDIDFESQEEEALGRVGVAEQDGVAPDGSAASLRTALRAKEDKFNSLMQLASRSDGSASFALDLVTANERSLPIVGAQTSIRAEYLTDERILEGIAGTQATKEEVEFQLKARKRGDASFAYASIAQVLPEWGRLPEQAILSLVEAERIFLSESAVDSAPYIVAFAKALEIYLHKVVFESFRDEARSSFLIGQFVQEVLSDGRGNKAFAIAKYIDSGGSLTLGTMVFFLPLCTGRSATKIPLLLKLKEHIVDQLRIPVLLEKATIGELGELASAYRNKAAHEKPFNREGCSKTRALVFKMLCTLTVRGD